MNPIARLKTLESPSYNYVFDRVNGNFLRWGKTPEDDPQFSPVGPEILDIELTTICHGGCRFCYKSNTTKGTNMSYNTFVQLFEKFPPTLTQIAFGIGDIDANPDLFKIMYHTRENGVIPNITINGSRMAPIHYQLLATLCGAVAVSNYDTYTCYNAVAELNRWRKKVAHPTLQQVNIHQLLSETTYKKCWEVLADMQDEALLKDLNAVVFLLLKPKGSRNDLLPLRDQEKYEALINYALDNQLRVGFDSCNGPAFMRAIKDRPNFKTLSQLVEPCESTLFSLYIDVEGNAWPCSFCEEHRHLNLQPINILEANDFLQDVWYHSRTKEFRKLLLDRKRECPAYDLRMGRADSAV